MMFVLLKLLLATAVVLLCYAVYRQLRGGGSPRRVQPTQQH